MLDPELAAARAAMPQFPNGFMLDFSDIPAFRAMAASAPMVHASDVDDPRVTVETLSLTRDDGSLLDVILFRPLDQRSPADQEGPLVQESPKGRQGPSPALLWFHAGGQVMGDAHYDVEYHADLAVALGCVLAAVDYRLAPETRAPGAAEDGFQAYAYLVDHAAELGVDPDRIGLAGASGGSVAAGTALLVRDRKLRPPRLLSLLYPMLDDRMDTPSNREDLTGVGIADARQLRYAWEAVLGDRFGTADVDPYSAPARATDLSGLPETFIAAAQYDNLRDENIDFARRLIAAGVPTDLHVYAGAFHAWDRFAPRSALTRSFQRTWHTFLRSRLNR